MKQETRTEVLNKETINNNSMKETPEITDHMQIDSQASDNWWQPGEYSTNRTHSQQK